MELITLGCVLGGVERSLLHGAKRHLSPAIFVCGCGDNNHQDYYSNKAFYYMKPRRHLCDTPQQWRRHSHCAAQIVVIAPHFGVEE